MNEMIDVLEHILTGDFVHFGRKDAYFGIVLAVTAYILFLGKDHLQSSVLLVQKLQVCLYLSLFQQCCIVHLFL